MGYLLTIVRMAIIKKFTNNKCQGVWSERNPPNTVGGNVNWYSHYEDQYGDTSKKTKKRATI